MVVVVAVGVVVVGVVVVIVVVEKVVEVVIGIEEQSLRIIVKVSDTLVLCLYFWNRTR